MYCSKRIAVVIPCFRVEKHIRKVIADVPEFVDDVVAVNDASPDATARVLGELSDPRLEVISHKANLGVGGAMVSGYRRALELKADIIVKIDGDGQMRTEFLEDLLAPIVQDAADYTKGNRFYHIHKDDLEQMPFSRLAGSMALTFLTKLSSGYWRIFDPQNGYTAISREALLWLELPLLDRRYFFENQMLILLNTQSARVMDVPIPCLYGAEQSSLRIRTILRYYPLLLLRGFVTRLYRRHLLYDFSPIVPLLLAGIPLFVFGILFGAYHWLRSYSTGQTASAGTVVLAALSFFQGNVFIVAAFLCDYTSNPRIKPRIVKRPGKPDGNGRGEGRG